MFKAGSREGLGTIGDLNGREAWSRNGRLAY